MNPVEHSRELARIAALPRRTIPPELPLVLGTGTLRPIQAWALAEIRLCRGLLGPISVGAGKTLISYLAPRMVDARRPLLLVPAKLRDKTHRDFEGYQTDWPGPAPAVLSYELLGRGQSASWLEQFQPDMIIADEAHRLKNPRSAVTRRVGRWMGAHPETVFVALSGTLTSRSLADFAHLVEWALGDGAPVPLDRYELESWCQALDEDGQWADCRRPPGALLSLGDGSDPRTIYRERLVQTPGVVASTGRGVASSLLLSPWAFTPGREILQRLRDLRATWETPDGQPIMSAADLWRHAREIAQGFWYRWRDPPPPRWLEARRIWAAFVREKLSRSRTLDSESQVAGAYPEQYKAWSAVKDTYTPVTVPEWFTPEVVDAAAGFQGIIWVEHRAVGEALQARGVPYYGALGRCGNQDIDDAEGPIAASIAACSEGRNLQRYHRNLILSVPTTGDRWEQLLGRTHREGQREDTVEAEIYFGCAESVEGFRQALSDAEYQSNISGESRKLILADWSQG